MLSQKELGLVEKLKALYGEMGRRPTRDEFMDHIGVRNSKFGSLTYNQLLTLAGIPLHPNQQLAKIDPSPPKILLLDIETAPLVLHGYGLYNQNHSTQSIKEDVSILSFAAKWLNSEEIIYHSVKPEDPKNDYEVVKAAYDLINQCDVLVCHNIKYDSKMLRGRWLFYDFPKEREFRTICTLQIARKNFKLTSNKLGFIAKYLGVINKVEHEKYPGISLFIECANGNKDAFRYLEEYNVGDILTLEGVYLKLRRYDKSIRFSIFNQDNVCSCGSKEFRKVEPITTNSGVFETWQCIECGFNLRDTNNLLSSQLRKHLMK